MHVTTQPCRLAGKTVQIIGLLDAELGVSHDK